MTIALKFQEPKTFVHGTWQSFLLTKPDPYDPSATIETPIQLHNNTPFFLENGVVRTKDGRNNIIVQSNHSDLEASFRQSFLKLRQDINSMLAANGETLMMPTNLWLRLEPKRTLCFIYDTEQYIPTNIDQFLKAGGFYTFKIQATAIFKAKSAPLSWHLQMRVVELVQHTISLTPNPEAKIREQETQTEPIQAEPQVEKNSDIDIDALLASAKQMEQEMTEATQPAEPIMPQPVRCLLKMKPKLKRTDSKPYSHTVRNCEFNELIVLVDGLYDEH
jgi:hypothetical protein